ncbi:phage integrase SAM-like domain-containing protein [Hymenobacter volaticus]|uniref:Phage integrase SAM-like domain-containing protein n=1 Tax=Hymenobacter volaticus TaxID=2932254 RepID=A0ABY4G225_9BACT|nr:phage integrase SAM-like domain-containing protein [Hymenobacter volaticus]UOQ64852.1 phage integrase SAM-like domain-containing protein [Hymenobacter volaticus]
MYLVAIKLHTTNLNITPMATITVLTKDKNKSKEQPLWVMLRHGRVEVPVSVGLSIDPKKLRNGVVVGSEATHVNKLVGDIKRDLQQAYDLLVEEAVIPITREMIRAKYELVKSTRLAQEAKLRFMSQVELSEKREKAKVAVLSVEDLQLQLEEDERKLEEKRNRLLQIKGQAHDAFLGLLDTQDYGKGFDVVKEATRQALQDNKKYDLDYSQATAVFDGDETQAKEFHEQVQADQKDLFVVYVQKFLQEQKQDHAQATVYTYQSVIRAVNDYNPGLRIQDVSRVVLYDFQDHLIRKGSLNSTIEKIMSQVKGIMNYFQFDLNLSLSYKQYKFKLPKLENDILYFSLKQLEEFVAFTPAYRVPKRYKNAGQPAWERMKDQMIFMCATGLRFSDIYGDFREYLRTHRDGSQTLELYPQKTHKKEVKVIIQVTPMVRAILDRHNWKFAVVKDWYFRQLLRDFCSMLPSCQEEVTLYEYAGTTKRAVLNEDGKKPKFWELLGTHTGRRTWINFAFQSGWALPQIMGQSGHTDMKTLSIYASKASVEHGVRPLNFFNQEL